MKKLTIVTPTLNCGSVFASTIASVQPLLDEGAEFIVVDSGSDDGTVDLARAGGAKVLTCPKGNMYAAINEGLKAAKGEWITYINGDDILYADAIFEMLEKLSAEADLLYGNIDYIDEAGRFLFWWRSASPQRMRMAMGSYCGLLQQGAIFHRRVLDRLEGFDTRYRFCADYDFFCRVALEGFRYVKYTEKSVAAFRLLATQLSQAKKGEMCQEGPDIRARYWEGKPTWARQWNRLASFIYRNATNLDSRLLRKIHARGLDKREY